MEKFKANDNKNEEHEIKNTAQYRRTAWIWQKMNSILTNRYIAVTIL